MLILVVGPSGAGKDTLLNGAREALSEVATVRFVQRVITRAVDAGEEAHESVDEQEFGLRQEAGAFALSWRAHGLHYGIPADIAPDLAQGRLVVANVSRAVVAEAAQKFPVTVIEVSAPAELLRARPVGPRPRGFRGRGQAPVPRHRTAPPGRTHTDPERRHAGAGDSEAGGRDPRSRRPGAADTVV